jgi:hypothetical protein
MEIQENNDGIVTAISGLAQTQVTSIIPFMQSDVITHWTFDMTWANTQALVGGVNTTSAYFPDNIIQAFKLQLQYQFSTIDVESGIDLALFQAIRPWRRGAPKTDVLFGTESAMYSPQVNQVSASNFTNLSATINRRYEIPVSIWFDSYFDIAENGNPQAYVGRALVSPQYMSGTSRIIAPSIQYAAASGIGNVLDTSPFTVVGGAPTYVGATVTQNIQRHGWYQPAGQADSPVVYNWQYIRSTKRFSLSGVSQATIPVQFTGQVMALYVRLWDPAANGGLGAPIAITAVTQSNVVYGAAIPRFQQRPRQTQARFLRDNLFLPTSGVLVWDFATNDFGEVSNVDCLNTMTTSGVAVKLTFTGTLSVSAYCVMGIEGLTFVNAG